MEEKTQDKYKEPIEGETQVHKESPLPEKEIKTERRLEAEPPREKIEERLEETDLAPSASEPPLAKVQQKVKQLKNLDRQNQVKALSDLAFQQGLDFAIEVAKGLDNAYVLDEFHDSLVDELRKELIEKGKLKKL